MNLIKKNLANENGFENSLSQFLNDAFLSWPDRKPINNWNNVPAVNIAEDEEGYTLEMAVPGLKKENFKIELDNNRLSISSEIKENKEEKNDNYTRREFGYSSFKRSFQLPEEKVNEGEVKASYEDGVLKIYLPKKEEAKPQPVRLIDIA